MSIYKKWFREEPPFDPSAIDEIHIKNVLAEMDRRKEFWQYAPLVYKELKDNLTELFPQAQLINRGRSSFRLELSGVTLVEAVLSSRKKKLQHGDVIELWLSVINSDQAPELVSVREIYDIVNKTLVYASPECLIYGESQAELPYRG